MSSSIRPGLVPAGPKDSQKLPRAPQLVVVHSEEPPVLDPSDDEYASEGVIRSRLWPATVPQIADETSGRGRARPGGFVRFLKATAALSVAVVAAWSLGSVLFPDAPRQVYDALSGPIAMVAQGMATLQEQARPSDNSASLRSVARPAASSTYVVASADSVAPPQQQPRLQAQAPLQTVSQLKIQPLFDDEPRRQPVAQQPQPSPPQIQQAQLQQPQPQLQQAQAWPQPQAQQPQQSQQPQVQPSQAQQAPTPQPPVQQSQAPQPPAPQPQAAQAAQVVEHLSPEETNRLLELATKFLTQGDLATGRRILERVAQTGNAKANLLLGSTYDPDGLKKLGMIGVQPDLKKAQSWYARAAELGSREASQRLTALGQAAR